MSGTERMFDGLQNPEIFAAMLARVAEDGPGRVNGLGDLFFKRFLETNRQDDIDKAISAYKLAIELTPSDDPRYGIYVRDGGGALAMRFNVSGNLLDINQAIPMMEAAIAYTTEGDANYPRQLSNLGLAFGSRFERIGDLADSASAISNLQRAIQFTPEGDQGMPTALNNLGVAFLMRFERTGDIADITTAITTEQRAIQLAPEGHPKISSWLINLGNSFATRFERIGDLADIASAISNHQRAIQLTPEGHRNMPAALNNLGTSFLTRFERTGDLADIASAISTQQRAIQLTPEGRADMPNMLNNLGNSFFIRFKRTGDLVDIANAISTQQRAVHLTSEGHPKMPSYLSNLGNSFASIFEGTGNLADITTAISNQQRAVKLTPEGGVEMPDLLTHLGSSFQTRFERTGDLVDISSAISNYQRALQLTPEGHTRMSALLYNLGNSFHSRFTSTHAIEDIHEGISMFRRAATELSSHPSTRLSAARKWAHLSRVHDKEKSLDAFSVAIQLLPLVAGVEETIQKRHRTLTDVSDITASAAAAALEDSELEMALAWLEQGRCLVWNQINHLRTPADNLRAYDPSLADHFLRVARALEVSGSRQEQHSTFSEGNISQMISLQEEVHTHVHLAKEWNGLLVEIRSIPKFQDFLQPPQASRLLSHSPTDGPVVIFNMHKDRCDALVLISGLDSPIHVPLETFSLHKAIQLRDDLRRYLTGHHVRQRQEAAREMRLFKLQDRKKLVIYRVLRELWELVAKPILDALAYSPQQSNQSRIWWCPTGPLAFLPIHAAGIYGKEKGNNGLCVSDYVVSSYTPTVSALLDKIKEASTTDLKHTPTSLLIISQPSTPGQTPIPGAKTETHALSDTIGPPPKSLLLEDASATVNRVRDEMKTHGSVHFACHAIQDVHEPLKSGVQLHDGRLEIMEMMKQTVPNADLAFLSACQTSTGDEKLSDEVVHLAAGMLAAGYRSIVATMWSIKDQYGPVIANDFYSHILGPNYRPLDGANAACALHYATQKLRQELGDTEEALLTWVPYVHFGV